MVMSPSPTLRLRDGSEMPQIGMGTWKHHGTKAADAVYAGLQNGYRLIDGACGRYFFIS